MKSQDRAEIRQATIDDIPAILLLVQELADYENEPDAVTADLSVYTSSFNQGFYQAFVAEIDGDIVGMALYYHRFSTWKGPMLYLEDFVVTQQYRRRGIGELLFEAYLAEAKRQKMSMCMWQVLDWNEPAINFYKKHQAIFDEGWVNVKIFLDSSES